ncbi:hypothetical protein EDF31_101462 [Curtobacterium sp. PhB142]|uniref:VanZ family protein n=1 Tax=unclassified Curtobacterium TaxID=257496 RepID=UPI00104C7EED|nr:MULTISPECIES: VanZ family protein [unclassified Curtobacterium]TCL88618.1 hypothetical protein EDF31_101462 [Curtobacterium sp. PhB142]TCM04019.1 hypothetical protein EDF26_102232 [Curtobacterium sp. PhB134]
MRRRIDPGSSERLTSAPSALAVSTVDPASAQVLFNVLLFVPLGALARHAVARRRVFAGLLANTTGAVVGTLLAPLVGLLAGSGRATDADAPRPVTAVWATRGRRGLAPAVIRADVEDDRVPARVD